MAEYYRSQPEFHPASPRPFNLFFSRGFTYKLDSMAVQIFRWSHRGLDLSLSPPESIRVMLATCKGETPWDRPVESRPNLSLVSSGEYLPFYLYFTNSVSSLTWPWQKDGLQWIIDECYATGDPEQLKPGRVLHRLVYLNDISLHSTSYTAQNVVLDLASADPSIIPILREESARVLKEAGGQWTRQAVTKLKLVDSTIRESMRMTPFNSVGLPRKVRHIHLSLPNRTQNGVWNINPF